MPLAAANANKQIAALQSAISARKADGKVTTLEAKQLIAQAKKEHVQGGELMLLRMLAAAPELAPGAKDGFVKAVDQIVPAGAPTAQIAAILFRLDADTGRKQLLALLDNAKNPYAGGPKTFVVTGLGPPYLAAITTAQMMTGLAKFLDGASPAQAVKMRRYLGEQLKTLSTPVSRGGVAVPGMIPAPRGLALSVDTRVGNAIAVNQNAVVLRSLERVLQLEGKENLAVRKQAQGVANRLARELKAELEFAYPAKGRLAYSLVMRGGRPTTGYLEDGNHLKTTLDALKALKIYGAQFEPVVKRMEKRIPEIAFAGTEDLSGAHGQIFTAEFNAFREAAKRVQRKPAVTQQDVVNLAALANKDGLLTPGERGLLARVKARIP